MTPTPSPTSFSATNPILVVLGYTEDEVCGSTKTTPIYTDRGYLYYFCTVYLDAARTVPLQDYVNLREAGDNKIYEIAIWNGTNQLYVSATCPGIPPKLYYYIVKCGSSGPSYITQGVPQGTWSVSGVGITRTVFRATSDGSYYYATGGSTNSAGDAPIINVELTALTNCP
jgi:hypothetical protein